MFRGSPICLSIREPPREAQGSSCPPTTPWPYKEVVVAVTAARPVAAPTECEQKDRMGERQEKPELPRPEKAKRAYQRPEIIELGHVRDLLRGGMGMEVPRTE